MPAKAAKIPATSSSILKLNSRSNLTKVTRIKTLVSFALCPRLPACDGHRWLSSHSFLEGSAYLKMVKPEKAERDALELHGRGTDRKG